MAHRAKRLWMDAYEAHCWAATAPPERLLNSEIASKFAAEVPGSLLLVVHARGKTTASRGLLEAIYLVEHRDAPPERNVAAHRS